MSPREIFLNACADIAANFTDFKPTQKCQKLTKISGERDVSFEIYFQSSMRNYAGSVTICPHIAIGSKRLKKLMQEDIAYATDLVFTTQLGYLTPRKRFFDWQLAGASYGPSVAEICAAIRDYALGVFELFADKQKAVSFMAQNGAKFNENLSGDVLQPIYFAYYFGGRDAAEAFFNACLSRCTYKGRFYKLFEKLEGGAEADFSASSFESDAAAKFAYLKGIKILKNG